MRSLCQNSKKKSGAVRTSWQRNLKADSGDSTSLTNEKEAEASVIKKKQKRKKKADSLHRYASYMCSN